MAELEHWRDIKGYVGLYEISDKGRVASFSRKYAHKETIILVPNISDRGYALVTLCKNGKTKHFQVHRLVAEAFIDNPKNKPQVNHIDGNRLNNCKENLEWATAQENNRHKYEETENRDLIKQFSEETNTPINGLALGLMDGTLL